MEDFIPDNQFVSDEVATAQMDAVRLPSAEQTQPDFVPDQEFTSDEDKYGTMEQTSKAVLESLGRGVAGPLFTGAETALGVEPQAIAGRREQLGTPADIALQTTGFIAPSLLTGGVSTLAKAGYLPEAVSSLVKGAEWATTAKQLGVIGNLATRGIEGQVARLAAKYGIEGAALALSDDISNQLISTNHENASQVAQNMIAHSLASGIFGAILGAGVGKLSPLWTAKEGNLTAQALENAKTDAGTEITSAAPENIKTTIPEEVKPPTSLEEISKRVKEAKLPSIEATPVNKQALLDANSRLAEKSKFPVVPLQSESLDNELIRDKFGIFKESDLPGALDYRKYEAAQKAEGIEGIRNVIKNLSKNPIDDVVRGGRKALDIVKNQYSATKSGLEEFFNQFDNVATNPVKYAGEVTGILENAIPGIDEHLTFDGINGKVGLEKWRPTMPFTEETHKAAQAVIDAINEENLTLGKIRNARNNLDPYINYVTGSAKTNAEVSKLKSSLMDFIESEAQKIAPNLKVRENFRAYAINEQNREALEKMLRGKLFGEGPLERPIVAEDVLRNLFANTNTTEALRSIVGEKNFNSILGDYMSQAMKSVTDIERNGFSSNKFFTFLKNKSPELAAAFKNNPEWLQEIKDWNTIMRILPDAPSVNPSGTAKTLYERLKNVLSHKLYTPSGAIASTAEYIQKSHQDKQTLKFLNDVLAGRVGEAKPGAAAINKVLGSQAPTNPAAFKTLLDYYNAAAKGALLINKGVHGLFDENKMPAIKEVEQSKLDKLDKNIERFGRNPNDIQEIGGHIGHYAPEQVAALTLSAMNVANYINSQRPQPKIIGPLNKPIPVTSAQKGSYYRTLQIAENPMIVFKRMSDGTLHSKDVIDFKNMYPDLYGSVAKKAYNQMMEHTRDERMVPYKVRKSLSLFAGQPLDSTMKPEAIQSAQAVFQPQQQPQQEALPQMAKKSSRKSQLPSITQTDQQRRLLKK